MQPRHPHSLAVVLCMLAGHALVMFSFQMTALQAGDAEAQVRGAECGLQVDIGSERAAFLRCVRVVKASCRFFPALDHLRDLVVQQASRQSVGQAVCARNAGMPHVFFTCTLPLRLQGRCQVVSCVLSRPGSCRHGAASRR